MEESVQLAPCNIKARIYGYPLHSLRQFDWQACIGFLQLNKSRLANSTIIL